MFLFLILICALWTNLAQDINSVVGVKDMPPPDATRAPKQSTRGHIVHPCPPPQSCTALHMAYNISSDGAQVSMPRRLGKTARALGRPPPPPPANLQTATACFRKELPSLLSRLYADEGLYFVKRTLASSKSSYGLTRPWPLTLSFAYFDCLFFCMVLSTLWMES